MSNLADPKDLYRGLATPVYFIGESHTLPFRNVLFQSRSSADMFVGRVRFVQVLASQFCSNGALHPEIRRALQAEQIMSDQGAAAHLAKDRQSNRIAEVSGIVPRAPLIILFAGDLDVWEILRKLGPAYDFALPDDPGYGMNPGLEAVPLSVLNDQITALFKPFSIGCTVLKDMGFAELMIHSLPPRIRDTKRQAWTGTSAESQVRAKITVLANRILAGISKDLELPFIDTWPHITEEGYLKPELCLDGIHMTRGAALFSLEKIVEGLIRSRELHKDFTCA